MCQFEWVEKASPTVAQLWCCTRELGHQGQYIAGTGEYVTTVRGSWAECEDRYWATFQQRLGMVGMDYATQHESKPGRSRTAGGSATG
jgi:hypothetical protein